MMTLHSVRWPKRNSMSNCVGQHFVGALISTYHNHLNWVPVIYRRQNTNWQSMFHLRFIPI